MNLTYSYTYMYTYTHTHAHTYTYTYKYTYIYSLQITVYSIQYTVYTRILYMYAIVYTHTHLHIHCFSDELRLGVTASILSVIKDIFCALTAVVPRADQLWPREIRTTRLHGWHGYKGAAKCSLLPLKDLAATLENEIDQHFDTHCRMA